MWSDFSEDVLGEGEACAKSVGEVCGDVRKVDVPSVLSEDGLWKCAEYFVEIRCVPCA